MAMLIQMVAMPAGARGASGAERTMSTLRNFPKRSDRPTAESGNLTSVNGSLHPRDFPSRKTPHTASRMMSRFEKLRRWVQHHALYLFKDELSDRMTQDQVLG